MATIPFGNGKIIYIGFYIGQEGIHDNSELERLMTAIVSNAGCQCWIRVLLPKPSKDGFVYFRSGVSNGVRVIIVFLSENVRTVTLDVTSIPQQRFNELFSQREFAARQTPDGIRRLDIVPGKFGLAILIGMQI